MIESRYWKEDLLNHAKRLKLVKNLVVGVKGLSVILRKKLLFLSFASGSSSKPTRFPISAKNIRLQFILLLHVAKK